MRRRMLLQDGLIGGAPGATQGFGPIALALLKRAALTSQALTAGESAILVDPDFIPAEEQSQAGRAAINRLRGSETQQ